MLANQLISSTPLENTPLFWSNLRSFRNPVLKMVRNPYLKIPPLFRSNRQQGGGWFSRISVDACLVRKHFSVSDEVKALQRWKESNVLCRLRLFKFRYVFPCVVQASVIFELTKSYVEMWHNKLFPLDPKLILHNSPMIWLWGSKSCKT